MVYILVSFCTPRLSPGEVSDERNYLLHLIWFYYDYKCRILLYCSTMLIVSYVLIGWSEVPQKLLLSRARPLWWAKPEFFSFC